MIATVFSAGIYGIEGYLVTVECGLVNGLPSFELVGLPGAAVKESKERVTTAARSIGMALLPARKTVNLAPADIRKEGAVYDLPILLGLLAAQGNIEQQLPEFRVDALEVLRQPLEDGTVSIVRTAGRVTYPAKFMLICAMNPCKCGWYGHPSGRCKCTPAEVKKYRRKISGPLLDRIDIQVHVRPVPLKDLSEREPAESSADIRARVIAARERQQARYAGTKTRCNADMQPAQLAEFCRPDAAGQALLDAAFKKLGMTARSYDRILRLARTIADLAGEEQISAGHIAEAIQYRSMDRE